MSQARDRSNADGAGALLGAAAADQLVATIVGSGNEASYYGYQTQQATMVAYHLMRFGRIQPVELADDLADLAYSEHGPSVYRSEPDWFRSFLAAAHEGTYDVSATGSGAAARTVPLALWHRWDPAALVAESTAAAAISHPGRGSIVAAAAYAGAVAAASFGQHGIDFVNGVQEVAVQAGTRLEKEGHSTDSEGPGSSIVDELGHARHWLGQGADEVISAAENAAGELGAILAAVLLGSVNSEGSRKAVEDVAATGDSAVAFLVGGIVGARRGVARWPWQMPNEHWFAELGRRMVAHGRTYEDLPDPYSVELNLMEPDERQGTL